MKKKLFLLSMLAAATITSCKKDVDVPSVESDLNTKITLSMGEYGNSRSIESTYGGKKAAFLPKMKVNKYAAIAGAGDAVGSSYDITFEETGVGTDNWVSSTQFTSAIKSISLTANYDGQTAVSGAPVLSSNVNTRQGFDRVQLFGTGDISRTLTPYTAAVNLVPEMARVEITSTVKMVASAAPVRTAITVKAIYINNTKLERKATILEKTSSVKATWNKIFGLSTDTEATKYKLYDDGNWALVHDAENVFGADKTLGYNIFPQGAGVDAIVTVDDAKAKHPHLIFKVDYTQDGVNYTGQYLTITNFKTKAATADFVQEFEGGKVYQFDINEIYKLIEEGTELSPDPDPEKTNVTITVTVADWEVVPVTPGV